MSMPELLAGPDPLARMIDAALGADGPEISRFVFGTCHGQFIDRDSLDLLTVINEEPGNGHFVILIEVFEKIASETNRDFRVIEIWNDGLKEWLRRRGYKIDGDIATHQEVAG